MRFVDPRTTPFVRPRDRGELPHLLKPNGTYFVTFRLWDAVIPSSRKNAVCDSAELTAEELLEDYDPPITLGSCLLRQPVNAELVANAIRFFDKKRYELPAWCVMPNHVHAIVSPYAGHSLGKILHSWKSFTSHELKKLLNREGSIWERESFDHLVRSEKSLEAFVEYVEQNPVKAGLVRRAEDWPFSSAGRVEV